MASGSAGMVGRMDFNAEGTEASEKMGVPHPGCFCERVRKLLSGKELWNCAVQKSAEEYERKGFSICVVAAKGEIRTGGRWASGRPPTPGYPRVMK
jgi:hypothetical protein